MKNDSRGFVKKSAIIILFLCAFISPVFAATGELMPEPRLFSPSKAIISPNSARLSFSGEIITQHKNGYKIIEFLLPEEAENLQLDVPGQIILRWNSDPFLFSADNSATGQRDQILQEATSLKAQLATAKARIEVWKAQTSAASAEELEKRQSIMQEELPELSMRQTLLEQKISLLERELAMIPETGKLGQKISIILADQNPQTTKATVNYTYDLAKCGWQPLYNFDAVIDEAKGENIKVSVLAQVWQYSGMDWKDTEITLATQGDGARQPAPLPEWIVGKPLQPHQEPRILSLNTVRKSAGASPEVAATADAVAINAPVVANTSSLYATWNLAAKGLPEGKSTVSLGSDEWKTKMEWLGRPAQDDNRVWLYAKYDLPPEQAWPAGYAQFSVNGQNIDAGYFSPTSREATLYFGTDPRVNIRTEINMDRQGETGFINTSKTWTGAWTYTISNEHDKDITVKVERPAPQIANEKISVSYKDNPPSTLDESKHLLFWIVNVPAHGTRTIQHGITISSPEKLPLLPSIP